METLREYPNCQISGVGLNRTMQYGNNMSIQDIFTKNPSLNRTMQYGNYYYSKTETQRIAKFKSYYVVWKQHSTK